MTDYIKREDVKRIICKNCTPTRLSDCTICKRIYEINEIPSADVVERRKYENCRRTLFELSGRKQGEWLKLGEDIGRRHYLTCSVCRRDIATYDIFHFCPNCGAMMTRGENNEID